LEENSSSRRIFFKNCPWLLPALEMSRYAQNLKRGCFLFSPVVRRGGKRGRIYLLVVSVRLHHELAPFAALCHVLVQLNCRGATPQHTWATGIIINHSHILGSPQKNCITLCHFLVQLNCRWTAPQRSGTWAMGMLINHSHIPVHHKKLHMQHFATFSYNSTAWTFPQHILVC
jgi:hypothetical protein